jgi:hypothetical protein
LRNTLTVCGLALDVIADVRLSGVGIALTGVHSSRARPAVTVAAAEDDWTEAEREPGRG